MNDEKEVEDLEALVERYFKTPYPENAKIRTYVCAIISDMLDNPKGGIYPTTKCYDRLEQFVETHGKAMFERGRYRSMCDKSGHDVLCKRVKK